MALTKNHVILFLAVTLVLLIGSRLYFDRETYMTLYKTQLAVSASRGAMDTKATSQGQGHVTDKDEMYRMTAQLIEQRNNLSKMLNLKQQKIGQMECEKNIAEGKLTKSGQDTSNTGGWCMNGSKEDSGHHKTDKKLIPVLADFFKGKYVASFGDGPGRYKNLLLKTGKLKGYDAYDGAPFTEKTSEGRVKFLDLTLPQYGLPLYDWVMSLEVAEHIPAQFESIYIDNVVRHAKEGVVLSWAKLGQQGYSHVNNRPFTYVKALFEKLGFEHDEENSKKLQKAAKLEWLQWNTNVYRRKDLSNIEHLKTFET